MTPRKKRAQSDRVYRMKVSLKGAKPPIWRRIDVTGDVTLHELHRIIQAAMGWENAHLHQFFIGDVYYGEADDEFGMDLEDETKVVLDHFHFGEKSKFRYDYDFGDDWRHEILIDKVLPKQPDETYPVCVKGKGACPPEDVGGIWGYADFLEIMADADHPEREEMLEWVGGQFDPDHFDLDEVNKRLKRMR